MNKIFILVVLSFLMVFTGYATENKADNKPRTKTFKSETHIIGHVLDAQTKEHVPFVTIQVKGTTIGVITDENGHYSLTHIDTVPFVLTASAVGYKTAEVDVKPQYGKTIEVDFDLEEARLSLDEVVVSASRTAETRRRASGIVNVLSTKTFERTAAASLAEAMNYQPGVRVTFDCSNCGLPQMKINGLGGQYTQILLDSRPLFSSLASVYGLEQLPPAMIERVEIIRGGGSASFGSNAIGGVVNIITKEPRTNTADIGTTISVNEKGGHDINTKLNGSVINKAKNAGVYVFGMLRDRSAYDRDDDGFSDIPELKSATLGMRAFVRPTKQSKITAEYHHIYEYRRGGDSLDLQPHQANIAEALEHSIDGGGLNYDWLSKDFRHKLNVYASAQNIERKSYFGTAKDPDAYGNTSDITVVTGAQYTHMFPKLGFMPANLSFGVEYNYNKLHDVIPAYHRDLKQEVGTIGAFLQNEWKTDQASILLGVRVDKNSQMKNVVAVPRISFRYEPIEWVNLRVSYSSGYRAPQAYDEDLHINAVGGEVAIVELDPNLRNEYSHSVSTSAEFSHTFGSVATGSFLAEGFYTNIDHVFTLIDHGYDTDSNKIMLRTNGKGAYVTGLNLEYNMMFSFGLNLQAAYTFQKSRYLSPLAWSETAAPITEMLRSPDNYGYISADYTFLKSFEIGATANFTGSMLVDHYAGYIAEDMLKTTPMFCDLSLRFAYSLNIKKVLDMRFSIGVKNAFDSYQTDLDRGVDKDAGYIYGPNMPRTYYVGVQLTL